MEGRNLAENPTQLTHPENKLKNLNYSRSPWKYQLWHLCVHNFVKNTHTHSFTVVHWLFRVIHFQSHLFFFGLIYLFKSKKKWLTMTWKGNGYFELESKRQAISWTGRLFKPSIRLVYMIFCYCVSKWFFLMLFFSKWTLPFSFLVIPIIMCMFSTKVEYSYLIMLLILNFSKPFLSKHW